MSQPLGRLPLRTALRAAFQTRPARTRGWSRYIQTTARRRHFDSSFISGYGVAGYSKPLVSLVAGGGLISSLFTLLSQKDGPDAENSGGEPSKNVKEDTRDSSLPRFRLTEIREHGADSETPWVTHGDKVYDITDWIPAHPGGEVILKAAGGSIDSYWNIFSVHQQPHVQQILDEFLIGLIDTQDLDKEGNPPKDAVDDPFETDPKRDARLHIISAQPCNAEPPDEKLTEDFLTPNELFYVRNHMWVPEMDEEKIRDHRLVVELPNGDEKEYTLAELRGKFAHHRVTAVLQCSGNRRSDMDKEAHKTNGLQWGVGAISNAEWEGIRLMDVLADAGLKTEDVTTHTAVASPSNPDEDNDAPNPNTHHVQFTGAEAYGASIPLSTAIDPRNDVLLAFKMNGVPLPRDHGFPLRAVIPGHVAARSVKWLSKIVISDEESHSQWQRRDYKSFGPNEGAKPDWERAAAIQEVPITSAITKSTVETLKDHGEGKGKGGQVVKAAGYAFSGGGREVRRVDISLDGGKTWDQAELLNDCSDGRAGCKGNKAWAWKRWTYQAPFPAISDKDSTREASKQAENNKDAKDAERRCTTVVVKATDDSYNTQPESEASIYNVRGNLAHAWHRVKVCTECASIQKAPEEVSKD